MTSQPWADAVRELRVHVEEIADMLGPLDACKPIEIYATQPDLGIYRAQGWRCERFDTCPECLAKEERWLIT
ncbi:hypothetical protein GCM10009785_19750 [Brooklawnia cerclae]|uniref:Uncharacterized protein n=1 Tax=Brooklawnia cerclae TaxID=349934 RepID=A0ABX0SJS3_9ACTN|nr:hypothetical protein [Brooklawnia cerclae]NIH57285.1 hypothetical protein [Brooklawnia cerclae]